MGFVVVIPARYASSRLPGKPLLSLAGRPMIQHVYERALASGADEVIIATDDERIQQAALTFDADVMMTSESFFTGTSASISISNSISVLFSGEILTFFTLPTSSPP